MPPASRCQAYSGEPREAGDPASDRGGLPASPGTSAGRRPRPCAPPAARPLWWQSGGDTSWERRTEALLGLTRGFGRRCPRGPAGREPAPYSLRRGRPCLMPLPEPARRDSAEDAQWSRPECQAWTATLLLGTCLLYCTRVSMPVCAVSMSQDFGWNKKEAGIALSSFFWGYCLTQVAGGHLGDRVGGEKIILLSATAWGVITTATPLLTHLGGAHLVFMTFSRILTGLLQGRAPQPRASVCACTRVLACACSCRGALSRRALVRAPRVVCLTPPCRAGASPPQRRGRFDADVFSRKLSREHGLFQFNEMRTTILGPREALEARRSRNAGSRAASRCVASGSLPSHGATRVPGDSAGTGSESPWVKPRVIVMLPLLSRTLMTGAVGSLLLDWYGWQSVFYVSGGLTLLWVCYVYRYLLSEQDLILAVGVLVQGLPVARDTRVPWRQLFRKPSVWAAIFSQFSAACSFFILLSWLPTFFKETFPSSKGWVFNVVPWLVAIPASLFSGFLSDHLISQGYRTITVRKFMQVMGLGLSSVFALCLGHTSSFCKSVFFASASIGLQTFNHSGVSVNIQDLAPSCAGVLFGVANTAGALAGVVGVGLSGYLIESTGSWTSMFNLVAAISSLGLCTFLLFGKAQRVDLSPSREDL
ncbi:voltage-gated purine nucleotide uniporter SLC17A9 [Pteropus medius]|uniref:solute carrier family 17 member 9 n=1 Tax=Pteropus vampyrus TaxID=132908 RepID=UPI00196A4E6D|nr:solute carrier family 17 member 9 [Pteropus giganteus]